MYAVLAQALQNGRAEGGAHGAHAPTAPHRARSNHCQLTELRVHASRPHAVWRTAGDCASAHSPFGGVAREAAYGGLADACGARGARCGSATPVLTASAHLGTVRTPGVAARRCEAVLRLALPHFFWSSARRAPRRRVPLRVSTQGCVCGVPNRAARVRRLRGVRGACCADTGMR